MSGGHTLLCGQKHLENRAFEVLLKVLSSCKPVIVPTLGKWLYLASQVVKCCLSLNEKEDVTTPRYG